MTETSQPITWEKSTQEKYEKILEQIPALVRGVAETRVSKKIESILRESNRTQVLEKDVVDALFAETPPGFIPLMKNGLHEVEIDFTKYGYK